MSKAIRPIHYDEQAVGRTIKSTKKHYTWKFALNTKTYTVELFASRFSGNKKLKINGEVRFEGRKQGKIFHISVDIDSHNILIVEVGKSYDLRIDGISYQILQKQAIFSSHMEEQEHPSMSEKFISDMQEDWEIAARPYNITVREGQSSTTREVLPIVLKKTRSKLTVTRPVVDSRYVFSTGSMKVDKDLISPEPLDTETSTTAHRVEFDTNHPFF